jgi:hypothetical protein
MFSPIQQDQENLGLEALQLFCSTVIHILQHEGVAVVLTYGQLSVICYNRTCLGLRLSLSFMILSVSVQALVMV